MTKDKTYLSLFDEYNKIDNENILFVAGTGGGKSLALETVAEELHNCGYIVIFLTDVKDKFEPAFAMFKPEAKWHLETLRRDARNVFREPQAKPVKIYHPFTFSFPRKKMPEMRLFTIPIKSIGKEELSVIAETKMETSAIKLFINSLKDLKRDEGISDLLFYAGQKLEEKTQVRNTKLIRKPDPDNFYLKAPISGTQKTLSEISTYFRPYFYGNHYFFTPDNCKLNFNPIEIFRDQKHYHVLSTKYLVNEYNVKDEKIADIVQLNFYKTILRNIDKCKHPIVFCIDEIRKWLPKKAEGYKRYLVECMKDDFSTSRSKGKGITTICATQVYRDIAPAIAGSMSPNEVYIGATSDQEDIKRMAESLRLMADEVRQIRQLTRNTFIKKTKEGTDPFKFLVPQHAHAEPHYDFIQMYARHYLNKMKDYKDVFEYMKELRKKEQARVREKCNKILQIEQEKIKLLQKRRREAKLKKIKSSEKVKPKLNKSKEIMKGVTIEMAKQWKELYVEKEKSYYEIAKLYGLYMKNGNPYAVKVRMAINKLSELENEL